MSGDTFGAVGKDYVDGYAAGFRDGPYDIDQAWDPVYRRGMQEGRTHRIDDELIARYGTEPDPDR